MEIWQLTKEFTFEAAHKLPLHDGKCARLHGHSWKGRVVVQGFHLTEAGPKSGMLVDYADLKGVVSGIVDMYLDHHYLNETTDLINPTSEEIARWVFRKIKETFLGNLLIAVEIDETCTTSCRYQASRFTQVPAE